MPPQSPARKNNKQVRLWSKRRKRWERLRKELVLLLEAAGFDKTRAQAWLNTPVEALRGRTPRMLLNPLSIAQLHKWARKELAKHTSA